MLPALHHVVGHLSLHLFLGTEGTREVVRITLLGLLLDGTDESDIHCLILSTGLPLSCGPEERRAVGAQSLGACSSAWGTLSGEHGMLQ